MTNPDPMPVFTIKAKDALALDSVGFYERLCREAGLVEQAAEVRKALREMDYWRARNAQCRSDARPPARAGDRMTDHAHYIHAVARHLSDAGFYVRSVGGHDWSPRGGHIELGCQDGWDHYDRGDADVLWDEQDGWRIRWGMTEELSVPMLAAPAVVAMAVGHHVGQVPLRVDGEAFDSVRAEPGTPEFDAALAAYGSAKEAT